MIITKRLGESEPFSFSIVITLLDYVIVAVLSHMQAHLFE